MTAVVSRTIEVADGMTLQQLFDRQLQHAKPENYLIRVSCRPAARDQVLVESDRVSMTPTKIEGAARTSSAA
jgi:hypothetical protein